MIDIALLRLLIIGAALSVAPFIAWRNATVWWRNVHPVQGGVDVYISLFHHAYLPMPSRSQRGWRRNGLGVGGASEQEGFIAHLKELRWNLLRVLQWVIAAFILLPGIEGIFAVATDPDCRGLTCWGLFFFKGAGNIYVHLAAPLLDSLPESSSLIAVGTASPVIVPMKAAFFAAVCIMMPYILYEMWSFVAPGLYDNEKGLVLPLIMSGAALFYAGILFAYFLVFKIIFGIIAEVAPEAINWTPDIDDLFGFMLMMFLAFGLVFEVPVAMFVLVRAGVVELEAVRKARPRVIVGIFIVAAIVTPPDVLSQFLLALPCWLLYEVGLIALNPKGWWKGVKEFVSKLIRAVRYLPQFLVFVFRSRKKRKKIEKPQGGGEGK